MSAECNSSVGAARSNIRKGVCVRECYDCGVKCRVHDIITVAVFPVFCFFYLFNHCRTINGDSGRCLEHSVKFMSEPGAKN